MTPADLAAARKRLGLSAADLGRRLYLEGRDPGRWVRAWEKGEHPIPGPVRCAIELMLLRLHLNETTAAAALGSPQTAIQPSPGVSGPPPESGPVDPPAICSGAVRTKTRRRG